MATKKAAGYKDLSEELDEVLGALQRPDIQVDTAMELYEQGLKLVTELELHLKHAENKLEQIKLQQISEA